MRNQGFLSISQRGWSLCQWQAPTVTRGFLSGMSGRSLSVVRKDRFSIQHLVSSHQENLVNTCVSSVQKKYQHPQLLLLWV